MNGKEGSTQHPSYMCMQVCMYVCTVHPRLELTSLLLQLAASPWTGIATARYDNNNNDRYGFTDQGKEGTYNGRKTY